MAVQRRATQDQGPYGIYINKKTYVNYVLRAGKTHVIKIRAKGLDVKRDKLITDRAFIDKFAETTIIQRFDQ